jgi:hypothetical protein
MLLSTSLCLIISTAATVDAPSLPAWRGDLPQARKTDEGTYLPAPLDAEVLKRLLYLDRYPKLCQESIDANERLNDMRMQAATEESKRSTWQWPAAVGVLTGIAAGYYFGHH